MDNVEINLSKAMIISQLLKLSTSERSGQLLEVFLNICILPYDESHVAFLFLTGLTAENPQNTLQGY